MSDNKIIISRILKLSKFEMTDCYNVIAPMFPMLADLFARYAMRNVNRDNHILFVAKTSTNIVGVLKGSLLNDYAKIDCFCVDKKYRGHGIGDGLLKAYENCICTESTASCICLDAAPGSMDFYNNRGYFGVSQHLRKYLGR